MATDYPQSYTDWHRCITVDCGIELTADYIAARIKSLKDPTDNKTATFTDAYGDDYRLQVLAWFEQAAAEQQ